MTDREAVAPLEAAADPELFGGKAASLARALQRGLPVPRGVALPWPLVASVAEGEADPAPALVGAARLAPFLAVRSSAVGEDSAEASFAGQHLSLLNVSARELPGAVRAVAESGRSAGARAYRERLGIPHPSRMGIVIQEVVFPEVAGVLFHPHPVTGADEVLVEASWGFGEAVVSGLVIPDMWRLTPGGTVIEARPGVKDVEVVATAEGGTESRPVPPARARARCLDATALAALHSLWKTCARVFDGAHDLEWCLGRGRAWLLQWRPGDTAR